MTIGANKAYDGIIDLPPLVRKAIKVALSQDFDFSCAPEHGRLLSVLAKGFTDRRIGETGTGCGVGLAWMVEATSASTSFVSIELDPMRAAASAALFGAHPNVRVIQGDWRQLRKHGPFDLLVLDGGGGGRRFGTPLDPAAGWLAVGGTIVVDDFTPTGRPGASAFEKARRYWLEHPVLRATEVRLSPTLATVVGMRVR